MKFKKRLLAIALPLIIFACSSDNKKTKVDTPVETTTLPTPTNLAFTLPEADAVLVEDFPIALYITYPENQRVVDSITSIDVNWPQLDIHQANKEYGFIDGTSEELFYYAQGQNNDAIDSALDIERQDEILWFVSGDDKVAQLNRENEELVSWQVYENAEFSEVTIDKNNAASMWLYDLSHHQLVNFNHESEQSLAIYMLDSRITLQGIKTVENTLLMLAQLNNDTLVLNYQVNGHELEYNTAWTLEGFGDAQFNDITLMPDDTIVVSTSSLAENIIFVGDKRELLGNGPIEDHGELALLAQTPLDNEIAQPSGLWSMYDGSWLIVTDQAEMYALNHDFEVQEKVNIEFDSIQCNQGCTEAIVGDVDEFFALTDRNIIGQFNRENGSYRLTQEFLVNVTNEEGDAYSYSGMGKNEQSGEYFLITDQAGANQVDELIILHHDFTVKERHEITYPYETDGSIFEFDAQGVQYAEGNVYVLSEKFTKFIKLSVTGEILAVYDIDPEHVSTPSDFAIRDGKIYVIGDHENDEPLPPVSIFEIAADE